ncbi:MAG: DNA mismatch repair endonuclease MutL, partial [Acidobacteria bacterium]|nr:DNA mismatch repair endonuclease MutL [Acidobacteriota bacterium]
LASIASVARVELTTFTEGEEAATCVKIEGGRMRDVQACARPVGTTIAVRDLFFNVPARRKFLRSEATESFHLTNLATHYALAHPEIAFTLVNNGREVLRCGAAADLRERAYQIFGAEFLESLLEVAGGHAQVARVGGYVSAPRERRTSRDAQYLFVNGRYVRDKLVSRALSEGYRTVLPHGVYPAALLFLEVPLEEVDVNVHPAKTEVRFRRASAVADAVREAVRAALAASGYLRRAEQTLDEPDYLRDFEPRRGDDAGARQESIEFGFDASAEPSARGFAASAEAREAVARSAVRSPGSEDGAGRSVEFESGAFEASPVAAPSGGGAAEIVRHGEAGARASNALTRTPNACESSSARGALPSGATAAGESSSLAERFESSRLPPLNSIAGAVEEIGAASANVRPLFQLEESYIVAVDGEGLLMIDQHAAHERVLFDKYRALEDSREPESQQLLVPETFDLTPAQAAAFDAVAEDLEAYGFGLMRLSGRTVAVKSVPADLAPAEARNMLAEALDAVDAERRGAARATLRERVAASLACRAAIKVNTPLAPEKMRWLIDRLLLTSSPTTCPHGRPAVLRLRTRDIERGFHRP